MPLMVLTASSILSVTSVSTCSGAAPGRRVVTRMVGEVDLRELVDAELGEGEAADHRQRQDEDRREDRPANAESGEPLHDGLPRSRDAHAVGELRDVARGDDVARLDAAGDLDQVFHRLAGGDDALLGRPGRRHDIHTGGA